MISGKRVRIISSTDGLNNYEKEIMKRTSKLAAEILRHVVDWSAAFRQCASS